MPNNFTTTLYILFILYSTYTHPLLLLNKALKYIVSKILAVINKTLNPTLTASKYYLNII